MSLTVDTLPTAMFLRGLRVLSGLIDRAVEAGLAELKAMVALSIAFIEGVEAAAFAGGETRRIELRFPGIELNFEGAGYLTSFALPNFYFHLSMAYALLRQAGVPLGKRDFLGQIELI